MYKKKIFEKKTKYYFIKKKTFKFSNQHKVGVTNGIKRWGQCNRLSLIIFLIYLILIIFF